MLRRHLSLAVAGTVLGMVMFAGSANAQSPADTDAVKAANAAFYAALSSRDAKKIEPLWADKAYVINISPRSKSVAVGHDDAVTKWAAYLSEAWLELNATMTSVALVHVVGKLAWVTGTEHASGKNKAGEAVAFDTFVTNIFEKDGDRWLMVSHHAQFQAK